MKAGDPMKLSSGNQALSELAMKVGQDLGIPQELRCAILLLLESPHPIRSEKELALRVGCDRTTLYRQWRDTLGPPTQMGMKDLIDWVLLVRAVTIRHTAKSWSEVATWLGMERPTLSRAAMRLTGGGLLELELRRLLEAPLVGIVLRS
jgi:hypothetical protein